LEASSSQLVSWPLILGTAAERDSLTWSSCVFVGLFWFGWGGYQRDVSYWVPTVAGLFIGYGIYTVFLGCLNYIIDGMYLPTRDL
jgi:uncharacterized membrane protein